VAHYPYRSGRERDCVQVVIQQDFCFRGSPQLFAQVLNNLIKNALHSLVASTKVIEAGDLRLTVGVHHGKGRIAVADEGLGMGPEQLSRIFEPFYSTQAGAGSGLGLSFCLQRGRGGARHHQGSLRVRSRRRFITDCHREAETAKAHRG